MGSDESTVSVTHKRRLWRNWNRCEKHPSPQHHRLDAQIPPCHEDPGKTRHRHSPDDPNDDVPHDHDRPDNDAARNNHDAEHDDDTDRADHHANHTDHNVLNDDHKRNDDYRCRDDTTGDIGSRIPAADLRSHQGRPIAPSGTGAGLVG
jgi:hypothetical protein